MTKPAPFAYRRAASLADVFAAFAEYGDEARVLAGGQSLMPTINMRLARPALLVDINRLDQLGGIEVDGAVLRIGALARHAEVLASPLVARHLPLLARAMAHVAHPAIRVRGTFGGSLCQADPAAEIPACLLALGGSVVLASAAGRREVAADDFLLGVMDTVRRPDEVLVEARVPLAGADQAVAFQELARRRGDLALVGVAAQGGRLVVFGCEPRPRLFEDLPADPQAAAEAVADGLDPMEDQAGDAEVKRRWAAVLTRRALAELAGGPHGA